MNSLQIPSHFGNGETGFLASIDLLQSSNSALRKGLFEAYLPLSVDEYGSYLFDNLFNNFEIQTYSNFSKTNGERVFGDINFSTYKSENTRESIIQGNLDRTDGCGVPLYPLLDHFTLNPTEPASSLE